MARNLQIEFESVPNCDVVSSIVNEIQGSLVCRLQKETNNRSEETTNEPRGAGGEKVLASGLR